MYIVFEGIDNSGKTTQTELVKERLKLVLRENNQDFPVITIAEKEIPADEIIDKTDKMELALRFALQRRLLLKEYEVMLHKRIPAIILSDRSYYSSMAYQGKWVYDFNKFVPEPSLIFFFDKGEPVDEELKKVYNNYFNVLPLSTIYVNTKKHSLTDTTTFITRKILGKWCEEFQPSTKLKGV